MMHTLHAAAAVLAGCLIVSAPSAQVPGEPSEGITPLHEVAVFDTGAIDLKAVQLEDEAREAMGMAPRYAVPYQVSLNPVINGTWDDLGNEMAMWRILLSAPGAATINLGFGKYLLPDHAKLRIYDAHDPRVALRPFTAEDNELHGELWTPVIKTELVMVELTIPVAEVGQLQLEITQIGYGYRGFKTKSSTSRSGSCNVDVICPEGDGWRNEIPSVGVISTGGSTFCTGFLVNNTANDGTPYFMTADHCGIGSSNASSLVVYWNYENSWCRPANSPSSGSAGDGSFNEFNTGSYFRSAYGASDFTLVELDDPLDPAHNLTLSGWDRSGAEATTAIAIHHPSTDEKRISFEYQSTTTTSYLGSSVPGDGTHVRVEDWDVGTTEGGSSGSPLYDQNHRVIGQLHGGWAACGNDDPDWYGRFSVSWTGGGSSSTRLSDWLDPLNTGAMFVDTYGGGTSVTPSGVVVHEGQVGGPFTNPSTTYTMSNSSGSAVSYQISLTNNIGILLNGGTSTLTGSLPIGGSVNVTVSLGPGVNSLPNGIHEEEVVFSDLTNGISTNRVHQVNVGYGLLFSEYFNSNPGWSTDGQWAYGIPTGSGGSYGNPDPSGGYTSPYVYGYELNGDYANDLPELHLTSTAIDCSNFANVELRFWRYLNVERPIYDEARIYVSNDNVTFTEIWMNDAEITDSAWMPVTYDISAVADGQSTVYLRWSIGPTDGSWTYSGWNIDDVELWGYSTSTPVFASATFRNAGGNPASYTVSSLPVLGGTFTGLVNLSGTTGHSSAWLVGYSTPLTTVLPGGQTLLVNIGDPEGELLGQSFIPGLLPIFQIPVPSIPALAGYTASTQALHYGGVNPWVLSNAQDLVLGY